MKVEAGYLSHIDDCNILENVNKVGFSISPLKLMPYSRWKFVITLIVAMSKWHIRIKSITNHLFQLF